MQQGGYYAQLPAFCLHPHRLTTCALPLLPHQQVVLQVVDFCADCGQDDLNLPPPVYQ